jgi:hypothetical protein
MPDYVIEQAGGRLTKSDKTGVSKTKIPFIVILENLQTADESVAFNALTNPAAVPNVCPEEYDGQRRAAITLRERVRVGVYRFDVDYELADSERSNDDEKVVDEWTVSFDTKGNTVNRNTSAFSKFFDSNGRNGADDNAFNGLIGLNADDERISATGTDVVIPQLRLNIDVKLASSTFTMSYINTVAELTGTVNQAAFPPVKGGFFDDNFAAGEVLCLGVTGTSRKVGDTTIGIAFAIEKNQVGLAVTPAINVDKEGWEYVWTWDEKEEVTIAATGKKYMVPKPQYAMVETVYPRGDFSQLGLS